MKILVTGGAGFIGSHLVDQLVKHHNIMIIDNLSTGLDENINRRAFFFRLDITDPALESVFQSFRPDLVFHLAAHISVANSIRNPINDMHNNITGSLNLFANCVKFGVHKIIYSSSAAVYGNPMYLGLNEEHPIKPVSFYGVSKHSAEHYLETFSRLYGIKYSILRYANVYGPRQQNSSEAGVVTSVIHKLSNGERPIIFGNGEQTRDFVYVADVVDATLRTITRADNEIINIGSGVPTSIKMLVSAATNLAGLKLSPEHVAPRSGDILHSYMNTNKAIGLLDWQPRFTLAEGLESMAIQKRYSTLYRG